MPLRRSYARSTRYRRRSTRRYPRRSTRRVISRRRPTRNRYNSRRRILNITSRKKQDNMLGMSANSDGSAPTPVAFGIPTTGAVFLWCATARDRVSSKGDPTASSMRETDTVFMRGLKESITFQQNTGTSWRWRRICFTVKGRPFAPLVDSLETSIGWTRLMSNKVSSSVAITDVLFRGTAAVDWQDAWVAKVDTQRVTVHYDKLMTLGSGNNLGRFHRFKHWYPMNKNLVYNNDENGEGETINNYSTYGKPGMGDYYIVDFFDGIRTTPSGEPEDQLLFQPQATLYWHEK